MNRRDSFVLVTAASCLLEGCKSKKAPPVQAETGASALARHRHPKHPNATLAKPGNPVLPLQGAAAGSSTAESCRVRLMAANITSGNAQAYEEPGVRIFRALKPDVVMLQEFNVEGQSRDAFVQNAFGAGYTHCVESDSSIPNGVVSRFPIVASGEWRNTSPNANRDYAWARIDVPGPKNLLVVSVHLRTKGGPRAIEEAELVNYMRGALGSDDMAVLGGDFNHDAHASPSMAGADAFLAMSAPLPQNMDGRPSTSSNLRKTLDHLFVSPALMKMERAVTLGGKTFDHGLVFTSDMASRDEIAPVLPRDSFAVSMQHMPIVRDFQLCEAP